MIGVKIEQCFELRIPDLDYIITKKKQLLEQNPGRDQPIMKDLLCSSMVWDKYVFNDGDDVEFGLEEKKIGDDG